MWLTLTKISFFSIIESMGGEYAVEILPRSFLFLEKHLILLALTTIDSTLK